MLPPPRELPERAPRLAEGRYVLLARIGRGGMAGVYAAWDTAIEEWRAVKVLLPKHARDGGLRTRFEREGLTMKSLQHPNLVRVFEVGSGEKLPFLVMELINGGSLYRWTKSYGAMPARMAVEAMMQLCAGLSAVHAAGVVHRDIKPRNVLINWDGVLKLTDFGIAQLGDSQETRTGLAMGTLGFMSPEQLHDAKAVDLRTDIYAIGATLWSQLTGRKARDLFRLEDTPTLMDGVAEPIRPLLSRCLAYERDDRYGSARDLADALSDLLLDLPEDPPDSPPLPLNLGSLSLKSKPENTFSEILTTLSGDEEEAASEGEGSDRSGSGSPEPSVGQRDSLPPADRRSERPQRNKVVISNPGRERSLPPELGTVPLSIPPDAHRRSDEGKPSIPPPRVRTSLPSVRSRDEPDVVLPSYLVGVEQPIDLRRPETITYGVEEGAEPVPVRPQVQLRKVILAVILVPLATLIAVLVVFGIAVSFGTWRVRNAAAEVTEAQVRLSDCVQQEAPLTGELAQLQADVRAMRAAFDRWMNQPKEPTRSEAAVEYVILAEQQARTHVALGNRSHEEEIVYQRLERLRAARDQLLGAETRWSQASQSPTGRLSTRLHLASAPREPVGAEGQR